MSYLTDTRRTPAILLLVCLMLWTSGRTAHKAEVAPALAIPLFLKIITYDESFQPEQLDGIQLLLLYDRSDAHSYSQFVEAQEFFEKNKALKVNDLDIHFQPVQFPDLAEAAANLSPSKYSILITTHLQKSKLLAVAKARENRQLHSFSFDPESVTMGISVSVRPREKRNAILVNLKQAKAEGSRFGARLLRMCEIYEGSE